MPSAFDQRARLRVDGNGYEHTVRRGHRLNHSAIWQRHHGGANHNRLRTSRAVARQDKRAPRLYFAESKTPTARENCADALCALTLRGVAVQHIRPRSSPVNANNGTISFMCILSSKFVAETCDSCLARVPHRLRLLQRVGLYFLKTL
jgi:hypothetical protein